MQDGKIVPDIEIARLQENLDLVRIAAHDLLQLLVRGACLVEFVERRDEGAGEVSVPSDALDLRCARVHRHGCVYYTLVQGWIVVVHDTADGHGGFGQCLE